MRFILATSLAFLLLIVFTRISHASIVVNEVFPNPVGDETTSEWVELYNTGAQLDIAGYRLKDAAGHELVIDSSFTNGTTIIVQNSWLVIYRNRSSFSLNNTGAESVELYNNATPSGQLVDTFIYNDSVEEKSWGRIPDGGVVQSEELTPTPGDANQSPPTPKPLPPPTPSPSPSQKPAVTPKPKVSAATPTPRPKIAGKTTASPKIDSDTKRKEEKATGEAVLGITQVSPSPKPEEFPEAVQTPKPARLTLFIAATLVLVGLGFLSFALAPFVKEFLAGYNKLREETREV